MESKCSHINTIKEVTPQTPNVCGECVKIGDTWIALRLCLTCGNVGCCNSSKNKHAAKHFHDTGHPIAQAYKEGNQHWKWCYIDQLYIEE